MVFPTTRRTARGLVSAAHPGPTAAVTAIMTALAAAAGRGAGAAWVGLAVLAGQLSVGWSNDYLDRHRDRRAGRLAKPVAAGALSARLLGAGAVVALVAAAGLSFASGWRAALAHLVGVTSAWAYNLGVKRTSASPLPYVLAFGLLPAFVTLGLPGHPWPAWWAVSAAALLGTAAHFTNVLPDIADDIAAGVRGLPHRLGDRRARLVSAGALGSASLLLIFAPADAPGGALGPVGSGLVTAAVVAAVALVGAPSRAGARARHAFAITVALALIDVTLLVALGTNIT